MLTAFTAGLLLITVSELGDKTFFIAAILAMRYPRRWVFAGAIAALVAMTVLSVLLGQAVAFLPHLYVAWAEVLLFAGFGLKLLYEARRMTVQACLDECLEAEETIERAEAKHPMKTSSSASGIMAEAFGLTFLGEWGDRTQIATITLAAANNPVGVTMGAVLGHAICAAIAVSVGRLVCTRLSERTITLLGGVLFLVFAGISLMEIIQNGN